MSRTHLELLQETEQRFRHIAWGCLLFYAVLALVMNLIKVEKPEHQDFTELSPRIASLLIKPPPPPPKEAVKKAEAPPAEAAGSENKETPTKPKKKPSDSNIEPTPEQVARHNRQVAMRSGLLKLLAKKSPSGSALSSSDKLLRGGTLRSVTNTNYGSGLRPSGPEVADSGGIDQLINQLGGKVEGIRLADKQSAAIENPIQLKDTEGKSVGRPYESVAAVVDGLKGWIRFIYNKALRENPDLKGVVTLEFTITKEGDVTNVSVASTTLKYPPIEEALVKRFKLLKFPASPKSGSVTVVYPITFSPLG
ncbi:MAG TPA: AgmX/PglI C-terminal domain-containing protein [Nitrospiria bacterium]|nr:AgmX/PglI C-terminal domain-containing protein [Nitrospiria bacterium]